MVYSRNALYELSSLQPESLRQTTCVLVVDDNKDLCEVMREMLEANGFVVLISEDGSTALEVVEEYPGFIDLLLTDIQMPRIRGPELAKRAGLLRPEMKVLFMSGDASEALSSGELDSGALILAKPFSWGTLAERVRDALRR